jgi:hypothetical protein
VAVIARELAGAFNRATGVGAETPESVSAVVRRLVTEMRAAWRAGACPPAEEFLNRYPELAGQEDAALRLIYEEVCLRQELGREVSSVEILHRFPVWQKELQGLLNCHRLVADSPAAPAFPEAGGRSYASSWRASPPWPGG